MRRAAPMSPPLAGEIVSLAESPSQAKSHLDLVGNYFDQNAGEWSDLYRRVQRVNDIVLADRKNTAVEQLSSRLRPGGRILDAGCGAGLAALDLAKRGYFVHGVDVAAKMLDLARTNLTQNGIAADRFELSCGDVAGLNLAAGSFDGRRCSRGRRTPRSASVCCPPPGRPSGR
jgi:2-polyprenyl-3-methyl-5-hydroxy-6-metoxy-1,4-benzoquinol methylase